MVFNVPRLLHETAERPLRIGACCVQENTETLGPVIGVNRSRMELAG